jgi:SAM-dependent methyltransferase
MRLLRTGKPYLIPVYYAMHLSFLAREGIENSGSYRFADHIYAMKPKGRFVIGKVLDAALLRLKSSRSMRERYINAKREIHAYIRDGAGTLDILAVPCGLGRELFEISDEIRRESPARLAQVRFHGLDLDRDLIGRLQVRNHRENYGIEFVSGDAMDANSYARPYDIILSTGFTEFMDDDLVEEFYRIALSRLKSGGRLITSGLDRNPFADYLLRNIGEFHVRYRTREQLETLAQRAGFRNVETYQCKNRLNTMLIAKRSHHVNAEENSDGKIRTRHQVG